MENGNDERKKTELENCFAKCFDSGLEPRIRLFNIITVISHIAALFMFFMNMSINAYTACVYCVLSCIMCSYLLYNSIHTGGYRQRDIIISIVFFIVMFPLMFFQSGGYRTGMPVFFIFAAIYTALFLEGILSWILIVVEMIVYIGCCVAAYMIPDSVDYLMTEKRLLADVIFATVVVSFSCVAIMYVYIVEYRKQKAQLEKQNERLEELVSQKDEFLAMVSHELKTPLTVISGYAQDSMGTLRNEQGYEDVTENMGIIINECARLALLVNQLSDLSRIESHMLKLHKTEFSPVQLVSDTLNMYYPMFSDNNNTVSFMMESDAPYSCFGDRSAVQQVLIKSDRSHVVL